MIERTTRARSCRGQAATETMIVMLFLLLMIFGVVHMSMFAATKYMVNLSAFAAARTVLVAGGNALNGAGREAAEQMIDNIRWWAAPGRNKPDRPARRSLRGRDSVLITYRVPFGLPMFKTVPARGVRIIGAAPVVEQPRIAEKGDNADF